MYHLKNIVNLEVLQEIQDKFCESTGFAAVTVDYTGKPITEYSNFSPFCKLVRKHGNCLQACHQSDAHGGLEAARRGKPYVYRCHSGLVDLAVPITVNGQYLGAIMGGQVKIEESQLGELDDIMKLTKGLLENKEIREAYENVPVVSYSKAVAAAQLMYTVANYIVEKDLLSLTQEELNNKNRRLTEELKIRGKLEEALRNSEIRALQFQINHHFMFNVLTTIGSLATIENAQRTQELVYSFADMLRYIVKNGNEMVRIGEEVDQTERYLGIQSVRFGSKINYIIDIDEKIREEAMPSMIIQPFVENAVIHGIEPKEGTGLIKILGYFLEENIILEVIDDGIGMSKQRLKELLENNSTNSEDGKSRGIGIASANKRIMHTYGEKYKVDIKSNPDRGTKVIIKIPRDFYVRE